MPILPNLSSSTPQLPPAATGVKQTIQARSGTATFVPKGHTISIINTYGRQVVDLWAFALHAVPTEEEMKEEEKVEQDLMKKEIEESDYSLVEKEKHENTEVKKEDVEESKEVEQSDETPVEEKKDEEESKLEEEVAEQTDKPEESSKKDEDKSDSEETIKDKDEADTNVEQTTEEKHEDETSAEQSTELEKPEEQTKRTWSSYIPSMQGKGKQTTENGDGEESPKSSRGWSSYIPSVPSVRMGKKDEQQPNGEEPRTWASYIPSGHGYSSYIPRETISSIASLHRRDPNKSVAEQVYDFSKTPVGAAGISFATGSGYASSVYAAYAAYSRSNSGMMDRNAPGMEYLSMEHTRAATQHISPRVGDLLVSNLRAPMITLLYDTSPGAHDTLMAACDPVRYRQLGVEKWAEHGSCAENLVLSLQQLNKSVGLKGRKAIGCDVTVNSLPAPLNLFMNIPFTRDGELSFEPPKGKRGDYVKFRAERDIVVVMSACPQDILEINGKKPMVAHFVVNSPSEEDARVAELRDREAQEIIEKARRRIEFESRRRESPTGASTPKAMPVSPSTESQPGLPKFTPRSSSSSIPQRPSAVPQRSSANPPKLEYRSSGLDQKPTPKPQTPRKQSQPVEASPSPMKKQSVSKPVKGKPVRGKPRKLERRASGAPTTPKA